jgi:hypothetical protein
MQKITYFTSNMFASTEHTSSKEKAEWANRLASFIFNGFKYVDFSNLIYTRLSNCFGHIAHYNRETFYDTWFSSPAKQADFIKHTLCHKSCGDPKFTFSDVEQQFKKWLSEQNIQIKVELQTSNERVYDAIENISEDVLSLLQANRTHENMNSAFDQCVSFIVKFLPSTFDLDHRRVAAIKEKMISQHS